MDNSKSEIQRLSKVYAGRGDPDGWFEAFYAQAGGDIHKVCWADLKPNPLLVDRIVEHKVPAGTNAITIGCGLGDDAELLAQYGYRVIAFDVSPSAIDMCLQRFPNSVVDYRVADLFSLSEAWRRAFSLVYECNTIQILSGQRRGRALSAIVDLVAPGGEIIVSCRSRDNGEQSDTFPLPLDREEIDGFRRAGLSETHFVAYDDDQEPPVPHFFAVYHRPV